MQCDRCKGQLLPGAGIPSPDCTATFCVGCEMARQREDLHQVRARYAMAMRLLRMVRAERFQRHPQVDRYAFYRRAGYFAEITTIYDRQHQQSHGWFVEVILPHRNGYVNPETGEVDTDALLMEGSTVILDGYDFPTEVDAALALFAWLNTHYTMVGMSKTEWVGVRDGG